MLSAVLPLHRDAFLDPDPAILETLATECERVECWSPGLDADIHRALFGPDGGFPPKYTGSIDLAALLLPKGWNWATGSARGAKGGYAIMRRLNLFGRRPEIAVTAADPALALCGACLRAHAVR